MSAQLSQPEPRTFGTYVLMTAAHNEEEFIEGTIRSVLAQTLLPQRWVIVSDNSTDRTDAIVQSYAQQHNFIRVLHVTRAPGRDFSSKVIALRHGSGLLGGLDYEFIGNLDADVSLEPSYFQELISHFRGQPNLGLVGGFVYENSGEGYRSLRTNDVRNVAHAAQLVRRECYDAIGGYTVLKYGGEDWYAQTMAKMKGWNIAAVPELKIFHHRHTTGGSGPLRNAFRLGRQDYSFGSDPFFDVLKCMRRIPEKPYFAAACARLAGFICSYLHGEARVVPDEVASFLRLEQKQRVSQLLNNPRSALRSLHSAESKRA